MYTEPLLEVVLNPNKKDKNLWWLWGLTISIPHLQENTQPWITQCYTMIKAFYSKFVHSCFSECYFSSLT